MAKKKHKIKPKKKSKSGQGPSVGSAEYSVLGALNEDKYRAPVEIMAAAKAVMLQGAEREHEFTLAEDTKKAAKKTLSRKVKVKK